MSHSPFDTSKPLPVSDGDSAEFWEGLNRGEFLLQHCGDCGDVQYYQQSMCRACLSENITRKSASGKGIIYTYSVVHRAPGPAFKADVPYAVLMVELDEGPRMISRLVESDLSQIDFDMPVEWVGVEVAEGVTLPCFRFAKD